MLRPGSGREIKWREAIYQNKIFYVAQIKYFFSLSFYKGVGGGSYALIEALYYSTQTKPNSPFLPIFLVQKFPFSKRN